MRTRTKRPENSRPGAAPLTPPHATPAQDLPAARRNLAVPNLNRTLAQSPGSGAVRVALVHFRFRWLHSG